MISACILCLYGQMSVLFLTIQIEFPFHTSYVYFCIPYKLTLFAYSARQYHLFLQRHISNFVFPGILDIVASYCFVPSLIDISVFILTSRNHAHTLAFALFSTFHPNKATMPL